MLELLKIAGVAFILFLLIDAIWLGVVAKKMYQKKIGHLMSEKPNFIAAGVFYLFFIVGLAYFVIEPAIGASSIIYAIFAGLFFGALTYGTYDLTNLATLKKWPLSLTIIDIIWGSALCGLISTLTYLLLI